MNARWDETRALRRSFIENWLRSTRGQPDGVVVGDAIDDLVRFLPRIGEKDMLAAILDGRALAAAEPMYVSEDVSTLWQAAFESFEPESLRPEDLIAPNGFALLPEATDVGGQLPYTAMLWLSGERAVVALQIRRQAGRWAISGTHVLANDGSMKPSATERTGALVAYRAYQAFWRLALQVVAAPQRMPRSRRREEMRHGSECQSVTILRLRRRTRQSSDDSTEVEWDHRWLVRGHWRNQWYPSLSTHRQIWISPHVKGPEDLPLVITDRVLDFAR